MGNTVFDTGVPGFALIKGLGRDGLFNEACALLKDASRAKRIMAHFAIPHVVVGWHSDGFAMCF